MPPKKGSGKTPGNGQGDDKSGQKPSKYSIGIKTMPKYERRLQELRGQMVPDLEAAEAQRQASKKEVKPYAVPKINPEQIVKGFAGLLEEAGEQTRKQWDNHARSFGRTHHGIGGSQQAIGGQYGGSYCGAAPYGQGSQQINPGYSAIPTYGQPTQPQYTSSLYTGPPPVYPGNPPLLPMGYTNRYGDSSGKVGSYSDLSQPSNVAYPDEAEYPPIERQRHRGEREVWLPGATRPEIGVHRHQVVETEDESSGESEPRRELSPEPPSHHTKKPLRKMPRPGPGSRGGRTEDQRRTFRREARRKKAAEEKGKDRR